MSRTQIFIGILTVMALLLLGTGVWAAPEQNPHRQTIPTRTPTPEEPRHPVADKIATYFGSDEVAPEPTEESSEESSDEPTADDLYDKIMELHDDGVGFGVIAQAFFIAEDLENNLTEDEMTELAEDLGCEPTCTAFDLIQVKQDGTMTWGEIKKLGGNPGNKGDNLGKIMSGRGRGAQEEQEEEETETGEITAASEDQVDRTPPGKGKDKKKTPPGKDKDKGGKGKGRGKKK
jgi:hypothetical protein